MIPRRLLTILGPALLACGCSGAEPDLEPTSAPATTKAAPPVEARRPDPAEANGPAPAFRDVAALAGIRDPYFSGARGQFRLVETMGSGIGLIDYDADGLLDLFVAQGCPIPLDPARKGPTARLYRNVGDGTFRDVTEAAGVAFPGYGEGVAVGDYDGDGRDDIYVAAFGEGALYRNKGDGTFEDATRRAGVGGSGWPASCAFADLDRDGDLDLYVSHYLRGTVDEEGNPTVSCNALPGTLGYCPPLAFPPEPDALYRNNGNGTFTEVGKESGITDPAGNGLGVVIGDWDEDGLIDIYVANDQTPNSLFRNRGNLKFEDTAVTWGLAYNEAGKLRAGMGLASGDYDGDGRVDLFVTNFYGEASTLYRNVSPGMFTVETSPARLLVPTRSKLGFGTGFLDYDNDGHLDLFITNGHVNDVRPIGIPYAMTPQLFRNNGRGEFADVSARAGEYFQREGLGRAVAFGDLDNDGDTDLVIGHIDRAPAVLLNETPGQGGFVRLTLRGPGPGRDATGARVIAEVGGRKIVRMVTSGSSYLSSSDRRILIGLGDAAKIDRLTIRWPSGKSQTTENIDAGTSWVIDEGRAPRPASEPRWPAARLGANPSPR